MFITEQRTYYIILEFPRYKYSIIKFYCNVCNLASSFCNLRNFDYSKYNANMVRLIVCAKLYDVSTPKMHRSVLAILSIGLLVECIFFFHIYRFINCGIAGAKC